MFNEDEDWNDEQDAQSLSKSVPENTQKVNKATNLKSKAVGKKSLLRTLQTLGSVPEWKAEERQQDSDSEPEANAPSHSKKKKKRRKKRKHAATSDEQQENGDLEEEKPAAKRRNTGKKSGGPKLKTPNAVETKEEHMTKSATININKQKNPEGLTRQQWKNKMKNKRKCKNKYQQNVSEGEKDKAESPDKNKLKVEVKTDSNSNNNNSGKNSHTAAQKTKQKECVPQKRKKSAEDTDTSSASEMQTTKEEKQLFLKKKKTKADKVEKGAESSAEMEITSDQQELPVERKKTELSKEQILKRERLRKMLHVQEPKQQESPAKHKEEPTAEVEADREVKLDRSASLRVRMEQRLESARFRYINEVLYSTASGEAKRMFKQDPEAFWVYHRGYTAQVQRWPANPVDTIISYIQQKPASLVVADFGCGDCKIARSVKNKVHSFDLAAACELVTVSDMANVPLPDSSVDIAVFCLSLMGTNLADFLAEANRVLKMRGILKIAEVASRFENVRSFITALANLGFKLVSKDTENTHFYSFEFVKSGDAPENIKKFGLQLKPCLYKKR
ncbi:ribosomal RNA-processing protein 8 [Echeneis naucrates]|uniref:Ribosomal RNA-processing protein 8 n=1 Tax=Echeneis naucrates TaxID=173247 RepID=A0A665WKA0_ECHNA|nr:ribosomal RNA-processing protein 8 [Echeneis naucrates]